MTPREKNLLIFLGATLFIILNVVAYSQLYLPQKQKAERARVDAEKKYTQAQDYLQSANDFEPEVEWLEKSGTTVTTISKAQSKLGTSVRNLAARKLEVRDSRILDAIEGPYFTRVRVSTKVTGKESDVVNWINGIHRPRTRQVVTSLEIKQQGSNPHGVECTVDVEQWIITEESANY